MQAVYIIMPRVLLSIMPRVYIIIQRCYSLSFRVVIVYHSALGVAIPNHADGLHHHAAGLIAYHAARCL